MSSGFRAPSMQQLYFNNISTQFQGDVSTQTGTFRNDSAIANAIGIPELKQEISTNLSAGFVYQPTHSFTLTADVYRIEVKDRIILSGFLEPTDSTLSNRVTAALANAGAGSAQFFMNAAEYRNPRRRDRCLVERTVHQSWSLRAKFPGSPHANQSQVDHPSCGSSGRTVYRKRQIHHRRRQPNSRFTVSGLYQLDQLSASVMVHRYGSIHGD